MSSDFRNAMANAGVDPGQKPVIADGRIHRFRGPGDKPGRKNCWYVLFDSGIGKFGSWRLGVEEAWSPRDRGAKRSSHKCRLPALRSAVDDARRIEYASRIWREAR